MGYWPDVKRGDKVQHNSLLENNVRHLLNSLDGFSSGIRRSTGNGVVRIQIWNASGSAMTPGQPVAFDNTKNMCGEAVPAIAVTDTEKPWGVCVNALAKNAIGDCIVSGPATVTLTGGSGDYAEPVISGTGFTQSETGTASVLYKGTGDKGVILLGSAGKNSAGYHGYFTIEDASEKDASGNITAYKVKVCDPRAPTSLQQCYVNSSLFRIAPWTSESLSVDTYTYIYIHFNAGSEASGTVGSNNYVPAVAESAVIEASETEPESDTDTDAYYQLGRVEIDENGMTILQDHVTGIVRMLLFGSWCPEDEEEE